MFHVEARVLLISSVCAKIGERESMCWQERQRKLPIYIFLHNRLWCYFEWTDVTPAENEGPVGADAELSSETLKVSTFCKGRPIVKLLLNFNILPRPPHANLLLRGSKSFLLSSSSVKTAPVELFWIWTLCRGFPIVNGLPKFTIVRMAPHFFLTFCWTWKVEKQNTKIVQHTV